MKALATAAQELQVAILSKPCLRESRHRGGSSAGKGCIAWSIHPRSISRPRWQRSAHHCRYTSLPASAEAWDPHCGGCRLAPSLPGSRCP